MLPEKNIAIAISQPWISWILYGAKVTKRGESIFGVSQGTKVFKDIENRSWHLPEKYQGKLVYLYSPNQICSFSKEWADKNGIEIPARTEMQTGKVLGIASFSQADNLMGAFVKENPWAFAEEFNWQIDVAKPVEPFLIGLGRLRFFNFEKVN